MLCAHYQIALWDMNALQMNVVKKTSANDFCSVWLADQ